MNSKKIWVGITVMVVVLLMIVGFIGCAQKPVVQEKKDTITVTDIAGRKVSVKVPVERVVLGSSRDLHEFAAVVGPDFSKKIVGWGPDLRTADNDTFKKFADKYPEIKDIPEVGYYGNQNFSIEKVVSLDPDLIIFTMFDYDSSKSDLTRFEQAGIPVVFTDFYQKTLENSTKSITLLGKLLGKEKRAEEIKDFYNDQTNVVYSRIDKINKTKPKVYIESGWKGASEYGRTYSDLGWGPIANKASGDNITKDFTSESATVTPEFLIDADPDIIIITGSNWVETPDSVKLGYYANKNTARDLLQGYLKRLGWNTLKAVQNKEVYSIFHTYDSRIYSFAGLQALAKWFYPNEFSDIDPEASIIEYHERFLPIDYSGTWTVDLK